MNPFSILGTPGCPWIGRETTGNVECITQQENFNNALGITLAGVVLILAPGAWKLTAIVPIAVTAWIALSNDY